MRKLIKAVTVAVAASLAVTLAGPAPAAQAEDRCLGFPSQPLTFVCLVAVNPENAIPVAGQPVPLTVPEFCYFLGCLPEQTHFVPTLQGNSGAVLVFTHNGQTYTVTGNPVGIDQLVGLLNQAIEMAGIKLRNLCATVSREMRERDLGTVSCA